MASKHPAEQRAERRRQREEEERRERVMVITEFDAGDPEATMHAMANEILRYREVLRLLARAISWADAGAPFGLLGPDLSGVRGVPSGVLTTRHLRRRLRAWRSIRQSSKRASTGASASLAGC